MEPAQKKNRAVATNYKVSAHKMLGTLAVAAEPFRSNASEVPTHTLRYRKSQQHARKGNSHWSNKAQTLKQACFQGYPKSTICVQVPVGSRNSAIHNAYRTSLRPSSLFEPRHPSLKVVSRNGRSHWQEMTPKRHARGNSSGDRQEDGPTSPTTREHLHEGTETVASSHRPSQKNAQECCWNMCE